MSHYHHLSIKERESIWELRLKGVSQRKIAEVLGRNVSTISRELSRNSTRKQYRPSEAQEKYQQRRIRCRRPYLLDNESLRKSVAALITEQQWSPEEIANRMRKENGDSPLSYSTIYRAIHTGRMEPKGKRKKSRHGRYPTHKHLRRKGWKIKKKKVPPASFITKTIDERPKSAEKRIQIGHWEGDLVYSSFHKIYVITLVDRCSRYLLTGISYSKKPEEIADAITSMLETVPKSKVRSITLDRGSEFALHSKVTEKIPNAIFYFAHPYSPWERGINENTNGLLRQYIPKQTYKVPFSPELLTEFTSKLNLRPRKCLNWKTPFEVFFNKVLHLT